MSQENEPASGNTGAAAASEQLQPTGEFAGSYLELMFGAIDHAARARSAE